jgi:hypothetical protein
LVRGFASTEALGTRAYPFLDALDQEVLAARAAYFDAACGGRPGLRQRVERLLQSHHLEDSFRAVPTLEAWAKGDRRRVS